MRVPVLLTVLLACTVPLAGCVSNPSTGRRQLILLSADQVSAMGTEAKPALVQEFGGEVASSSLRAYIDEIGRKLASHVEPEYADIQWEFITLDSDVINAFALPGGKVFITRGLLSKFENEAQVAGVLGHEIGHVTARHVDERISQQMVAEFGLSVLGQVSEYELITAGAGIAAQGALLSFGRGQEDESDSQGLKYMTAAGYDPLGMVQVLQVLAESSGDARPPEMLSTHPYPENRLERVQELIRDRYAFARGTPGYSLEPDRFQALAAPHLR